MASKRSKSRQQGKLKASRVLTWVGLAALAVAILVVGFFAFAGGDDDSPRRVRQNPVVTDEQQVDVDIIDNDFDPRDLTIKPGARVTWKHEGRVAHDVTDENNAFESGTMRRGDEFSLTFEDAGEYFYYCTLHHAMRGTIRVVP
jgi:plastocyanin